MAPPLWKHTERLLVAPVPMMMMMMMMMPMLMLVVVVEQPGPHWHKTLVDRALDRIKSRPLHRSEPAC